MHSKKTDYPYRQIYRCIGWINDSDYARNALPSTLIWWNAFSIIVLSV